MIVTLTLSPGPIQIPLPPLISANGGLCLGAVTFASSSPVPVLAIVIVADAVAIGNRL